MIISKSEAQTREIAKKLAQKVKGGGIICLYGDLGSGKTTFVKGLAEAFGIDDFSIKSPTYTYIRKYDKFRHKLYHIDLYRLEEIDDLLWQEIYEIMQNPQNIIIIEWADKMYDKLPKDRIDIWLTYLDENSRKIDIRKRC